MPSWFNWLPLAPVIEKYVDNGTRDLCTVDVALEDVGKFKVSLVGSKDRIELVRVETVDSDGNLSTAQIDAVSRLMDHVLSVVRLTYDVNADWVRWGANTVSVGAHDDAGNPNLGIKFSELSGAKPEIPVENIRNLIQTGANYRPLIKLLADAQMPLLPLQYRYLSLYKVLELEFRTARQWSGLKEVLEPYQAEFRTMRLSPLSLHNLIHAMRDKCVHIKIGEDDSLGIVGLDGPDAKIVEALIPVLFRVIANYLNGKVMGFRFVHSPAESSQPIRCHCGAIATNHIVRDGRNAFFCDSHFRHDI